MEEHRALTVDVNDNPVSVHDFLVSAWSMPEHIKYHVIRQRHELKIDLPYVPETARILMAVMAACAECIDAGDYPATAAPIQGMIKWYREHFDPHIERAIGRAGLNERSP